jgi:hypothetical protein
MRTPAKAAFAVAAVVVAAACKDLPTSGQPLSQRPSLATNPGQCGTASIIDLKILGTSTVLGTAEVWNDSRDLHIVVTPLRTNIWEMTTHPTLDLATVPKHASTGAALFGIFAYSKSLRPGAASYDWVFQLSSLGFKEGDQTYIPLFVNTRLTPASPKVIVWGDGVQIDSRTPHTAMTYTVQQCVNTQPPPGTDVVVFNDINVLDNTAMPNPSNVTMVQNLVNFTSPLPRNSAKDVWVDCGHGSVSTYVCTGGYWNTMVATMTGQGYNVSYTFSAADGILASIPSNVKVVVLVNPCQAFTKNDINGMKLFAAQGGRLVFVGEHSGYYGGCIPIENAFLTNMGALMTNVGNFIDCGYNTQPAASLRPHQITTGMTNVRMACSSEVTLGPSDFPLYYDLSNTKVLSAVATIDVTPLPSISSAPVASFARTGSGAQSYPAGFVPGSPTGQ